MHGCAPKGHNPETPRHVDLEPGNQQAQEQDQDIGTDPRTVRDPVAMQPVQEQELQEALHGNLKVVEEQVKLVQEQEYGQVRGNYPQSKI
jgi:hypothetical protein